MPHEANSDLPEPPCQRSGLSIPNWFRPATATRTGFSLALSFAVAAGHSPVLYLGLVRCRHRESVESDRGHRVPPTAMTGAKAGSGRDLRRETRGEDRCRGSELLWTVNS